MATAEIIQPKTGIDILHAGRRLRRCYSVHRAILRTLSGWMIAAPRFEDKYEFAYHLWDHAQHAQVVQHRIKELRGGLADANLSSALAELLEEITHAGNTEEMIEGVYLELLPALAQEYEFFLQAGDRAANAPEIALARRILADLYHQMEWATQRIAGEPHSAWRRYIHAKVQAAYAGEGPLDSRNQPDTPVSRPHRERFQRAATIIVDDRLRRGGLLSLDQRQALDYDHELVEQFRVYFNEIYAACILASIIFDASADAPLEFIVDVAHQCWDEARHSQFGHMRLTELGVPPDRYDPILYEQIEGLPVLHRFCHLTLNLEPFFMPRKRPRVMQYEQAGDTRSRLFADVDWSDEINHVRYGTQWMEWFLKDDARDVDDIKTEIATHVERFTRSSNAPMSPF
ncbi:MAG TPA: hypothetical protein VN670_00645 [Acidobacteriaceae bacterium]|nr:hypothetical protein [Acidobacteriaceae bacterium]